MYLNFLLHLSAEESGLPTPAPPKTALLDSPSNPRDSYDTSDESRGKPRDNDVARDESRSKSRDIDAMRGGPRDRTRARSPPPDIQMPSVDDIQMPPPPSQVRILATTYITILNVFDRFLC